jgi:phosphoribosylcarboxyaminoimidazole (NCAIR) mutase
MRPLLQRPQMNVRPLSVRTIVWLPPHAACTALAVESLRNRSLVAAQLVGICSEAMAMF